MSITDLFKSKARKKGEELGRIAANYDTRAYKPDETAEPRIIQLAAEGARVNTVDSNGMSPLMEAAFKGLNKTLQPLVDAGADVNAASTDRSMIPGLNALMWAAYKGNAQGIETLVAAKADVNAKGFQDLTALHFAARTSPEAVTALIERGADVNALSTDGRSPLFEAVLRPDNVKVVRLLLDAGASLDVRNKWSGWDLMAAATAHGGKDNPVAKLLREEIARRAAPVTAPVPAPAAAAPPPPKPAA